MWRNAHTLFVVALICLSLGQSFSHAQRIAATVAVWNRPFAVVVKPVTNKIYMTNSGSASVTVIDGATNSTSTVAAQLGAARANPSRPLV